MTAAFVFPGQGSQAVGMGKALADNFAVARAVFAEIDEALGEALSRVIWEGLQKPDGIIFVTGELSVRRPCPPPPNRGLIVDL